MRFPDHTPAFARLSDTFTALVNDGLSKDAFWNDSQISGIYRLLDRLEHHAGIFNYTRSRLNSAPLALTERSSRTVLQAPPREQESSVENVAPRSMQEPFTQGRAV